MASQALLTFRQLMLSLQRLCKEHRSGIMNIIDEQGEQAHFTLNNGLIIDIAYKDQQGHLAIGLIRQLSHAKGSFAKAEQQDFIESKLAISTLNIFRLLSGLEEVKEKQTEVFSTPEKVSTPVPLTPTAHTSFSEISAPVVSHNKIKMQAIEAQLATVIGPVAQIIYQDYIQLIDEAAAFNKLSHTIEILAKKSLNPSQRKLFQQGILRCLNQQKLKQHELIFNALKGNKLQFGISVDAIHLCLMNYNLQGGLELNSLKGLIKQIESLGFIVAPGLLHKLLRLIEKTGQTGLLEIKSSDKSGAFYFDKGQLINAFECGMVGKLIALDIMQWIHVTVRFKTLYKEGVPHNIKNDINHLIAESNKFKEDPVTESGDHHYSEEEETDLTNQAIFLAKSYNIGMAEKLLVDLVTSNNTNVATWLWLSRTSCNINMIDVALNQALRLQPRSNELLEDLRKFTLAKKTLKEASFVLHCPFCWGIIEEKKIDCPHCKAHFFISNVFFKSEAKVKADVLDKAIERYSSVVQQWPSADGIYSRFYLAMAYLNRKYYQEALDQFNEIVTLAPNNRALYVQSQVLLQYLNIMGIATASPASQQAAPDEQVQYKILVVEDSMVTRKVIARTLAGVGYTVFEAKDSIEALDGLEEKAPDLFLLDIILPGKSGYDILSEIRELSTFKKTPVIMLTSRDSLFDKIKGKVSEADEYLTKPFKPDELLNVVRKYLN